MGITPPFSKWHPGIRGFVSTGLSCMMKALQSESWHLRTT